MLKAIRYIFFIPAALIISVLISALIQIVGNMLFGNVIGWILSGLFGGMSFLLTGLYVTPKKTETIKYFLAILLLIISVLSVIGTQINGNYSYGNWAPIASAVVAIGSFKIPVKDLIKENSKIYA